MTHTQQHRPVRARRAASGLALAALTLGLSPVVASPAAAAPGLPDPSPGSFSVRVKVGAQPTELAVTSTRNPRRFLENDRDLTVDGNDMVKVRRDGKRVQGAKQRQLREGDLVRLVRVTTDVDKQQVRLQHGKVRQRTMALPRGKRKVVKGRDGVRVVRIEKTFHNGRHVDTERERRTVRAPKPTRVLVGTGYPAVRGAEHLNWRALAGCESGGNPRAVNSAGYYGLYQFDAGTWRSVGGSGLAHRASAAEQTYRAKLLYSKRGRSPWPHCGRLL